MGFQVRKRTKGKTAWANIAYSKRNGVGISFSFKPFGKFLTYTTGRKTSSGNKSRGRTTFNFGHGMRYVKYDEARKDEPVTYEPSSSEPSNFWRTVVTIFVILIFLNFVRHILP